MPKHRRNKGGLVMPKASPEQIGGLGSSEPGKEVGAMATRGSRFAGRILFGPLIASFALGAIACGGDGGSEDAALEAEAGEAPPEIGTQQRDAADSESVSLGGSAVPSIGDSVVKDAELELEVPAGDFDDAVQQIETVAPRYGGFVLSTSLNDADARRGIITLRVPSEDFERAVGYLKDVGEVVGEEISGRDVSQEFIDLEARIRHLEAQEAVFLDLMDQATSISQTITVQNQLSGLQLDIERLQGRLNFLEDRTALGTIVVSVAEKGAPAPSEPHVFATAWKDAVDVLEAIGATLIIGLVGFVLPLGALAAIGLFIFRQVKPRLTS